MFNWKNLWKSSSEPVKEKRSHNDQMEKALWEIKDIYDLETEEVDRVVFQKRNNMEKIKLRTKNKQILFVNHNTYFRG